VPNHQPSVCFVSMSPVMPEVLTLESPDKMGGAEFQLRELAFRLADRGWAVSFVLGDYGQDDQCLEPRIRLLKAYRPQQGSSGLSLLTRGFPALWRALAAANAEVYFHRGAGAVIGITKAFAWTWGRRLVQCMASDSDPQCRVPGVSRTPQREQWLTYQGMRRADLVLVQSDKQAQLVREHLGRQSDLLPNIWPGPIAGQAPGGGDTVLWVGSIRQVKRPLMVCELAARLPQVRFTMLGGVIEREAGVADELRTAAEKLHNVEWVGYVPPHEVQDYYDHAAFLLNTSSVEGFPNTFLQAWAMGLPVLTMYDPGDIVTRQQLGLCEPEIEGAAAAAGRLWEDQALRREIGERALAYVRANHHPDIVIPRLENMLKGL